MRQTRSKFPLRAAVVGASLAAVLGSGLAVSPAAQAVDIRSKEWYLDLMKAPAMWDVSTGKGITVALVDTGVNASQPELHGKVLPGKTIGGSGNGQKDKDGHGTAMAMLIAGDGLGGSGVQGLAPGARILPVIDGTSNDAMAEGIRYSVDHGARVINVSQGAEASATATDLPGLAAAVKYAVQRGSLVFASVGNDGKKGYPVNPPASFPGAVGITAVDKSLTVAKFANHGEHVAFAAPGVSIPSGCMASLGSQKGYCLGDGTSEASALASASAALIWSAHPSWTNNQVLRVMLKTAGAPEGAKLPSEYVGYGFVRPRLVLLGKGVDPGPADVNPLYPALSAKPSAAPSGSTGAKAPTGAMSQSAPASGHGDSPQASSKSSSSVLPWVGAGAGVLVIAAIVVFVALRSRGRRQAAAAAPQGVQVPPQGYAPNPYATQQPGTQQPYGNQPQQPYPPQQPHGNPPQGYGPPPSGGGFGPPQG